VNLGGGGGWRQRGQAKSERFFFWVRGERSENCEGQGDFLRKKNRTSRSEPNASECSGGAVRTPLAVTPGVTVDGMEKKKTRKVVEDQQRNWEKTGLKRRCNG